MAQPYSFWDFKLWYGSASAYFDSLASLFGNKGVSGLLYGLLAPNVQNNNYSFVLKDLGGLVVHNDNVAGYVYTIQPIATTPWPVTITPHIKILNNSAQSVGCNPGAGVTLTRADGAGTTGNRTLAPNSTAIIYMISANSWIIEGNSLT